VYALQGCRVGTFPSALVSERRCDRRVQLVGTATSGSAGAPFSFVITVQADSLLTGAEQVC
jgi:hypothetical protein